MPSHTYANASRPTPLGPVFGLTLAVATSIATLALQQWIVGRVEGDLSRRLGRASAVLSAPRFAREALAEQRSVLGNAVPLIALDGAATVEGGGASVPHVLVYGVDDRFWRFHDRPTLHGPSDSDVLLSPALASALGVSGGAHVTVTIPFPEDVPLWTLHGRRSSSRTVRLRVAEHDGSIGALSPLDTSRDAVAAYLSLRTLQADQLWQGRVNAILTDDTRLASPTGNGTVSGSPDFARVLTLDDYGLQVRADTALGRLLVDSRDGTLDDALVRVVTESSLTIGGIPTPALTTLVSSIRLGDRAVPYSFVTSIELQTVAPDVHAEELEHPPILLNEWAAAQLHASLGDAVTLEYPVTQPDGSVGTDTGQFQIAAVVPLRGLASAASLTPRLPGITGAPSMQTWMPRVPFDVERVRIADEDYWARHGSTPKAFVPPQVGRALWRSSIGTATSVVVEPPEGASLDDSRARLETHLLEQLTPQLVGVHARDLRADVAARVNATRRQITSIWWYALPVIAAALLATLAARLGRTTALVAVGAALLAAVALVVWPPPAWKPLRNARSETTEGSNVVFLRTTLPLLGSLGDLETPGATTRLGVALDPGMRITPFRVHDVESPSSTITAGPGMVRLGGVTEAFIDQSRFTFAGSLDRADEERANPWLLLRREPRDPSNPTAGPLAPIVPVVASVRTLEALSRDLGDDITIDSLGRSVRLRVMASLEPGPLDGVLWMRGIAFLEWLPAEAGYRWFSIERPGLRGTTPPIRVTEQMAALGTHVDDRAAPHDERGLPDVSRSWMRLSASGAVVILALAAWSSARNRSAL